MTHVSARFFQKVEDCKTEWAAAKKALHLAEDETQKQRIKIELTKSALYGGKVRNPKELQDLQNKSASLKRYQTVLEDRQIETMLLEEQAADLLRAATAEQIQIENEEAQRIQALELEKAKVIRDIHSSEDERSAALEAIEQADLVLYNQLRIKRRGLAVSKVVQKACSACGTTLNATLLNAAHSPNQINQCDNCGQILYTG